MINIFISVVVILVSFFLFFRTERMNKDQEEEKQETMKMNPAVKVVENLDVMEEEEDDVLPDLVPLSSKKTPTAKFDPTKSHIDPDRLAAFIQSDLSNNLTDIPGVGKQNATLIAHIEKIEFPNITTPYQLLGLFLLLKEPGMSQQEHCDRFIQMLQENGVNSHRNTIVNALSEKLNVYFREIYKNGN